MKRKSWFYALCLLLVCLTALLIACTSGEEEEDNDVIPPLDDDDDDDLVNPGNDDNDDGSGDDDNNWPDEACDGDDQPHQVVYTEWDQLGADMQTMLQNAFADVFETKDFYGRFVYWYGIVRECSRSLRDYYKPAYPQDPWFEETTAAQLAIAYLRLRGGDNMFYFHSEALKLFNFLDDPVPTGQDPENYFNNNQKEIMADPYKYLWYQLYWAKEAINADLDDFALLLKEHVCGPIIAGAEFGLVIPHSGFDYPELAQTVFDTFDDELRTWFVRLNPNLALENEASLALVYYE